VEAAVYPYDNDSAGPFSRGGNSGFVSSFFLILSYIYPTTLMSRPWRGVSHRLFLQLFPLRYPHTPCHSAVLNINLDYVPRPPNDMRFVLRASLLAQLLS